MSLSTVRRFRTSARARFEPGPRAAIRLRPGAGQLALGLGLRVTRDAPPGSTIRLDLVRRVDQEEQALGGLAIEITVREADGSPRTLAEGDR